MAQYGSGEQYLKEGHHNNPLQSTTVGQEIGGTAGTTAQTHGGHEHAGKHEGGILHRSGSGSSSSSEDDGEGGRRKKKGVMEKIKEKLPGGGAGDHAAADEYKTASATAPGTGGVGSGGGYGYEAAGKEEGHEKKGLMEKIKEKLPGGDHH